MRPFVPMHRIIPEGEHSHARIRHVVVSLEESERTQASSKWIGKPSTYVPPGIYVHLLIDGEFWMSDTPKELADCREAIRIARGDVLVAGLGIGAILVPLLRKQSVRRVLVLEKSIDVIALVEAPLRRALPRESRKLTVIRADAFHWRPYPSAAFNTILLDVWPTVAAENIKDMIRLRKRYMKCWRPGGKFWCWSLAELVRMAERQMTSKKSGMPLRGCLPIAGGIACGVAT